MKEFGNQLIPTIFNELSFKRSGRQLYYKAQPFTGVRTEKGFTNLLFIFYKDGYTHRVNGPAIYSFDLHKKTLNFKAWSIKGKSKIEPWAKKNGINLNKLTPEDIELIRMKWD